MEEQTVSDALIGALRRSGEYNSSVEVAPVVILWPDKEQQWMPLVPRLREQLPLITLGSYDPTTFTGPAIWVRALLSGALPDVSALPQGIPILYLPNVSKSDLRAVETCPPLLKPLAELQYRGVIFSQPNGTRDWTIAAFVENRERGLGIEVENSNATRFAIARALLKLAEEPVAARKIAPLRANFFDALLHPDEPLRILRWLDDPSRFQVQSTADEWEALRGICQSKYNFDPATEGHISAARLLGQRQGAWDVIWRRFAEAPAHYPHIPDHLRAAQPKSMGLFDDRTSWPQENEAEEERLRQSLLGLRTKTPGIARKELLGLEKIHSLRRASVWATLGHTPLANALEPLVDLVNLAEHNLSGRATPEIVADYVDWGWKVDAAALAALRAVTTMSDAQAICAALTAIYRPWLEHAAIAFQTATRKGYKTDVPITAVQGECIIFCDGLRFDLGQSLCAQLERRGYSTTITHHLAALPTVTPTAKPAVAPVAGIITGSEKLETKLLATGQHVTAEVLRRALSESGYQILQNNEVGEPTGRAWTEIGTIDSFGHQHSDRLAKHITSELEEITARVATLIEGGWYKVTVVTDHGWLYLPDGFPKADLPEHLTEIRKGRCARLKPGSDTVMQTLPWMWNPDVTIAFAPGIHCFEAGKEYEHGGLSAQECVTPVVTVTVGSRAVPVTINSIKWQGLRCIVTVSVHMPGLQADLRTHAGNPSSTLLDSSKLLKADGTVSMVVEDDTAEGQSAIVIITDAQGIVRVQQPTIVGGE